MASGLVIGFVCGFLVCLVQVAAINILVKDNTRPVDKGDKNGNL